MKRVLVAVCVLATACGGGIDKSKKGTGNNGTSNNGVSNNGTTGNNGMTVNNGVTPTNNATTNPNNGTVPPNNGTVPPNNSTTNPNNQTSSSNNNTTSNSNNQTSGSNNSTNGGPADAIHVQLVWDNTTDLDVHFAHELATTDSAQPDLDEDGTPDPWLHPLYDCNWRNPNPDWGMAGIVEDNPSEDIDDTDGIGPENINLEVPEAGVEYTVGVRMWAANGTVGPATATVRVYIGGVLELESSASINEKDMWEVAKIRDGVVTRVSDKVTPNYAPDGI